MPPAIANPDVLWPAQPSPTYQRFFRWWLARMLAKDFHAIRIAKGSREQMAAVDRLDGPLAVVMNHQSWWDPILGMHLSAVLNPSRQLIAPMELEQLHKFKILRRLGVFGLDPEAPESLAAMKAYLADCFARDPRTSFWITPQGEFADPRAPIRVRPGVAAVAASCPGVTVLCVAIEMPFWIDRKPELLIRVHPCVPVTTTTPGWTRAITDAMRTNASELASLAINRDETRFETLTAGRSGGTSPVYDLWLRLFGRANRIEATSRKPARAIAERAVQEHSA